MIDRVVPGAWRLRPRVVVSALLVVLAALAASLGWSVLPLIAAAAAPWLLVTAARFGLAISAAVVTLGTAWGVLVVMIATAATGLPMLPTIIAVWSMVGVTGALALGANRTIPVAGVGAGARAVWLAPLLGPLVWAGTLLYSAIAPGAARYSWVMMGDSANNLLFARGVLDDNGIVLGPQESPVPLPSAMLALSMSGGRLLASPGALTQHDITAFVVIWGLLIAASAYFAGAASAFVVNRSRPWVATGTGAAVSLLPLTWFVTGYPLEFGFFNVHLALPIVFLCWVAALSPRSPALSVMALSLAATLLLLTWTPLVLIPAALACWVMVRHRRSLRSTSPAGLIAAGLGGAQLLVFALGATLPSLLAHADVLGANGGVLPFPRLMVFATGAAAVGAAVLALLARRGALAQAFSCVIIACVVGVAALFAVAGGWTYYPTKLSWFAMVIFLVLGSGVIAGITSASVRSPALATGALATVGVLVFVVLFFAPRAIRTYDWAEPIGRIVSGQFIGEGDAAARTIFELADRPSASVLWQSSNPSEFAINFWLLQLRSDFTAESTALRAMAYGDYDTDVVTDLCEVAGALGEPLTVHTVNASLPDEVREACPEFAISVSVTPR